MANNAVVVNIAANSTKLSRALEGTARVIEYIFSSVGTAFRNAIANAGTSAAENPGMAGFALASGGLMMAVVFYMFAKGIRRILSGLGCIALALVLMGGSISALILAYTPSSFTPHVPIFLFNVTNATIANITANITNITAGG